MVYFRISRIVAYLSILLLFVALRVSVGADLEYQVKAEYLERFTRFVDWPAASYSSPQAAFVLCVVGEDPFGNYLNLMSEERKFQGRHAEIRHPESSADWTSCHLLFIASSEEARLEEILQVTSSSPILTVGDTKGFLERGVLINLYLSEGFVRFEINRTAIQKSGLRFSSRLLKLGRVIR